MKQERKLGRLQQRLSGKEFFELNADSTCLLVVDMQNAFLEPGAACEIPPGRKIIPKVTKLINFCRSRGIRVIWTMTDANAKEAGLLFRISWMYVLPDRVPQKIDGTPTHAFEIYPKMPAPLPDERQVAKHKYDAFHETGLDTHLRALGIDTVIITGVGSTVCVESTTRSAFNRDFKAVYTSDGTATRRESAQREVLRRMERNFARVMSISEVIEELQDSLDSSPRRRSPLNVLASPS